MAGPCSSSAFRSSAGTSPPVTYARYAPASDGVSATPALRSTALPGAQMPPPERAVEPPNAAVFSSTTTVAPCLAAVSAAGMPAAPLPATMTSNSANASGSAAEPVAILPPAPILEHVAVLRLQREAEGGRVHADWDIKANAVVIGFGAAG